MRFLWLAIFGLLSMSACSSQQPGCTAENCALILSACKAEFVGEPAEVAACTAFDRPPSPVDLSRYCVDACNAHPGTGQLASCLAMKAGECRDAGYPNLLKVIDSCSVVGEKAPQKTCDDKCVADRKSCDTRCSGGKACTDCVNAGRTDCVNFCTSTGYKACLDCSSHCGLQYVACSDFCPRVM